MTEKLKILEHHVDRIRDNNLCAKGRENIPIEVGNYIATYYPIKIYPFAGDWQRKEYLGTWEKAAVAVLENNFEQLSDVIDEKGKRRSFDFICYKCPNYRLGDDPSCALDTEFIERHFDEEVKKRLREEIERDPEFKKTIDEIRAELFLSNNKQD